MKTIKFKVTVNEWTNKGYNHFSYPDESTSKKELLKKLRALYPSFMTKITITNAI